MNKIEIGRIRTPGGVARALTAATLAALVTLGATTAVTAQQGPRHQASPPAEDSDASITLNFRDTDIAQITEAVAMATHRSIILDPRVRAQVTMFSSRPVTPEVFYQMYLSILQVHQLIAVPGAGGTIKVLPDANQRFYPGTDLPDHLSDSSDEVVTQVIPVKNVSATQLVPALRSLVPTTGVINAYTESNMLIISDHAANVARIQKIVARIDQPGSSDVEVVPMQNTSASEIVRVMSSLFQNAGQAEPGVAPLKMVADDRSNSVLVSGDPSARLRAKMLIASLDTPSQGAGDTQVRYLHYADADKLAPKLKELLTGVAQQTAGAGGAQGGATAAAQEAKNAQIISDPTNNALVITAPPKLMKQVNEIVDKLDIRRAEVLVEAIIVDVDISKSDDLGVNWASWEESNGQVIPGATFLSAVSGASLVDLATAITTSGSSIPAGLESGGTLAIGRINKNGLSFAAMLRALRSDTDSNIVATPSALTMDHQEATIKVVQEVPFVTGQYTSGSTVSNGAVTPFQTITQIEVGTVLKITPQINEGNAVVLKIDVESSNVIATPSGASGVTTSKREVSTNVLIEDGGIVVLGGLISNEYDRSKDQIPLLSSIPLLGELFKDRSASQTKTNLMIFLRPQILHDGQQTAIETNARYNFMRDQQRIILGDKPKGEVPMLRGVQQPELPQLPAASSSAPLSAPNQAEPLGQNPLPSKLPASSQPTPGQPTP